MNHCEDDPALAVPGFITFEAPGAHEPIRGWAREDGTAVFARTQNFGPLLEALRIRSEDDAADDDEIAARIVWVHGPSFSLAKDPDVAPERFEHTDDTVEYRVALWFAGDDEQPAALIQYRMQFRTDGTHDVKLFQLEP